METVEHTETVWQKHPLLTVLGALVANFCIIIPWGLAVGLIEDHVSDPSELFVHIAGCGLFALVFSVFLVALYLTGWGIESRFLRIGIVLSGSILLMAFWFVGVLALVFLGMGFLANLYS